MKIIQLYLVIAYGFSSCHGTFFCVSVVIYNLKYLGPSACLPACLQLLIIQPSKSHDPDSWIFTLLLKLTYRRMWFIRWSRDILTLMCVFTLRGNTLQNQENHPTPATLCTSQWPKQESYKLDINSLRRTVTTNNWQPLHVHHLPSVWI